LKAKSKAEELLTIRSNLKNLGKQIEELEHTSIVEPTDETIRQVTEDLKNAEDAEQAFSTSNLMAKDDADSMLAQASDMVHIRKEVDRSRKLLLEAKLNYLHAQHAHQDFVSRKKDVAEMKRRLDALIKGVSVELTEALEEIEQREYTDKTILKEKETVIAHLEPAQKERFERVGTMTMAQVDLARNHMAAVEAEVAENLAVQKEIESIRLVAQEQLANCDN